MVTTKKWDLFCKVIDNYGDIAVTWRLAQILTHDHQQIVSIWVDELSALKALAPELNSNAKQQRLNNIEIHHWTEQNYPLECAEVVIETFGCDLPKSYLMSMQTHQPIWINLDYFSAEPWVQEFHGMPSTQSNGLHKWFFYPCVLPGTGGLMREANYFEQQQSFNPQAWCERKQIPYTDEFKISLFGYENPNLLSLIDYWANASVPIHAYLPQSRLLDSLSGRLKHHTQQPVQTGQTIIFQQLQLHILPFLSQTDYDRLLWLCDVNFVRGEESMARAQWAGKPFIWHIYSTEDGAHITKLNAFWHTYSSKKNAKEDALWQANLAWNQQNMTGEQWQKLYKHYPQLTIQAKNWIKHLNLVGELTNNLIAFICSKTQ